MAMTAERPGHHNTTLQIPDAVWEKLCDDAEAQGLSVIRVLTAILAKHYRIARDDLPKPRRVGRPPNRAKG